MWSSVVAALGGALALSHRYCRVGYTWSSVVALWGRQSDITTTLIPSSPTLLFPTEKVNQVRYIFNKKSYLPADMLLLS